MLCVKYIGVESSPGRRYIEQCKSMQAFVILPLRSDADSARTPANISIHSPLHNDLDMRQSSLRSAVSITVPRDYQCDRCSGGRANPHWVPPKLLAYRSPDPMHWPRGVILELEQLSKYTDGDELRGLALYHIRKAAMARNWKKSIHCRTKHMTVDVLNALDVMRKDGEQDLMDLDDVASTIHTSVDDSGV